MLMAEMTLMGKQLTDEPVTVSTSTGEQLTDTLETEPEAEPEPTPVPIPAAGIIHNSVDLIWEDMNGKNTGWVSNMPNGYKQFRGPAYIDLNTKWVDRAWDNHNIWVEVEAAGNGDGCSVDINKATNTRVEIAWIRGFKLMKDTNKWEPSNRQKVPKGSAHPQPTQNNFPAGTGRCNFSNHGTSPFWDIQVKYIKEMKEAIKRIEPSGFLSVKPEKYFRFHGWASRGYLDKTNVKALFGQAYMRLIVEDPSKPDDRHLANFVAHIASDIYLGSCGGQPCYISDTGISRYKRITNEWQPLNFFSGINTKAELEANPPPFWSEP